MSKRDLTKLAESTPLSSDTILPAQKLIPRSIRFSEDDEAEIDRIDEYLRERGLLRTDATKIVRLALKAAFRDVDDDPTALGLSVLTIDDVTDAPVGMTVERIKDRLGSGPAFMSFDIDVMDPAYAPGIGSQVPGGLTSREALAIVRGLHDVSFVGFDIVEVNPLLDPSRTTASLAAHLIFEFMSFIALRESRG